MKGGDQRGLRADRSGVAARRAEPRPRTTLGLPWWRRHLRPLVALGVGVTLSLTSAAITRRAMDEREALSFAQRAGVFAMAMRAAFDAPLEVSATLPAFFEASTSVEREDFALFAAPALARHPGIAGIEWFPYVQADAREAMEAQGRREGVTDFTFREPDALGRLVASPARPDYLPMLYMEPPNPAILGLNLGFDPARRELATRAATRGKTVVSPRFHLVEDPAGAWALALYTPVYVARMPRDTVEARQRAWLGVGVVLLRPARVLQVALHSLPLGNREVVIVDDDVPAADRVVYESAPGAAARADVAPLVWSIPYSFADHRWRFVFAARTPPSLPGAAALAVLLVGLSLTAVVTLALGAWGLIRQLRQQVDRALQLGPYTLEEKLGEGGMGVVYRARHALLRRPTAVKVLHPEKSTEAFAQRFEREVRATAELTHPNTVAVYDYGRSPDGTFYYAMEYLDGMSLEDLVTRFGPMPAARVVHIVTQACGALAEAHAHGMVHRDVKPANLMLCQRGGIHDFVKVLDFGLVKTSDLRTSTKLSAVDDFIGTPLYMAPEAMNAPTRVGPSVDLYALGGVMYFLLTGRPPFERDTLVDLCAAHLSTPPPSPSARAPMPVPAGLERLVLRCLAKRAEERPASAEALREALRRLDDLGPAWTDADAAAWWEAHGTMVHRPAEGTKPR